MDILSTEVRTSKTFNMVDANVTENDIFQNQLLFYDELKIVIDKINLKLPTIYWIPKLHKNPIQSRFITNSVGCSTKYLSVLLTSCLTAIKEHVIKYCEKVYENTNVNLFWSIKNSMDVIRKLENKRFKVSSLNSYDFSTLYTKLPHDLINNKLSNLIEKTFAREKVMFLAVSSRKAFFTNLSVNGYLMWTCTDVCNALKFLMDNLYVKFGYCIFKQIIGVPMGSSCAPLIADLLLYCYERDFMLELSKQQENNLIDSFNDCCRYIDDILTMDNSYFEVHISKIYPKELTLIKSNKTDKDVSFLDLQIIVDNNKVYTKIYDKRDDYNFDIVNYPFLDGDVPKSTSYGIYISQLVRFARACSYVEDFNIRNLSMTKKLLKQGFLYHKLRKSFARFFHKYFAIVSKYNCSLKTLLKEGISHPNFYGDFLKKIKKIKFRIDVDQSFIKIVETFLHKGYHNKILLNTCSLVFDTNFLMKYKDKFN